MELEIDSDMPIYDEDASDGSCLLSPQLQVRPGSSSRQG